MKNIGYLKKMIVLGSAALIIFSSFTTIRPAYSEMKRLNMSYIYFGNTSSYSSYVERTNNSLQQISPNYFNLDEKGQLQLTGADKDFIKEMHKKEIKVIPFLSNHWNRDLGRLALDNRISLVKNIVQAIKKYDLDGINVDIENLTGEDRDNYSDFIKSLRKALPKDKIISVAVAPNPYNFQTGWQKSYDYEALGKYSDYLVIMTYDESYPGGPSGPVASASFVERSIKYAIERIPKDKIVLGIPFFGRYWKEGDAKGGNGISLSKVNELLTNYDSSIYYDEQFQSPMAKITIKSNDDRPYVGGNELEPGTYTIWYENDMSIKSKLKLVEKYDIIGTASWSLGQETIDTWGYYNLWLNGYHFIDTDKHWAEEHILSVEKRGWMQGVGEDVFSPETSLTRAQAAVTLVRALGLKGVTEDSRFIDVSVKHWAYKEISIAKSHGIIMGNSNGEFKPDNAISREEMAAILDRVLYSINDIKVNTNPFKDITKDSWAYTSIMKMVENKIFEGYDNETFRPESKITRAQMAALMDRISNKIQ